MPAAVNQVQRENVGEVVSLNHTRISSPFVQVLAPLAVLLIILRIFPILSWTILTSIGVHLLLARLQGVVVGKEVLFLELVLAFLAALPLGFFRTPSSFSASSSHFSLSESARFFVTLNLAKDLRSHRRRKVK